jgi:hypothetical protein
MRVPTLAILIAFALGGILPAQSPIPVIVPAAVPVATLKTPPTSSNADSAQAVLKMLQQMKAANEETLRKQAATLEQLDELEKAADQIRIYTSRS